MSWKNYGQWHIDHKIPLKYNKPSLEEVVQRLQYTSTQPMWASESMFFFFFFFYIYFNETMDIYNRNKNI